MSDYIEEETDVSESELEGYADFCYERLKQGGLMVKVSKNEYKCPYCPGKQKQIFCFKDLFQHASSISEGSRKRKLKDRGRHFGLSKYMQEVHNAENYSSESNMVADECPDSQNLDEIFVWPCMGIVANIPVQLQNGRFVGKSGSKIRDDLASKGFNPVRVHTLWNYKGCSGYAIVEFRSEWHGFSDGMRFEKAYEALQQGKRDYVGLEEKGDKLYCWVARHRDFHLKNVIGDHLRKHGDLKTVAEYQEEEKRKNGKLIYNLANTIEVKDKSIMEFETKYKETSITLNQLADQRDEMIRAFNEERKKVQQNAHDHLEKILLNRERMTLELEEKRSELKRIEKELEKREAHNEKERLMLKQQQNERAILEQKRVDEKVLKLAEDHQKEQQELHRKMIELEKQLDAKQSLELEIQRLKGNMQVAKHVEDAGDEHGTKHLTELEEELKDKEEELEDLDALNQALIVKELKCSEELEGARRELINALRGQFSRAYIGVKMIGELNGKTFVAAAKRKYPKDAEVMAAQLWSLWESYLKDPHWNPFRSIRVEGDSGRKETIIDEEDEKLVDLRNEYGDEPYQAVTAALMEMNKHNPGGKSYSVPELWNFKDEKVATIKEGISYLMKQWSLLKKRRHN